MRMKWGWLVLVVLLPQLTQAYTIGVVVELPDGQIYKDCVQASDAMDGLQILEQTELSLIKAHYASGDEGLCAIAGIGCSQFDCECYKGSWHLFRASRTTHKWSDEIWEIGVGRGCANNKDYPERTFYCARRGDVLGFSFGKERVAPKFYSWDYLCPYPREVSAQTMIINYSTTQGYVIASNDTLFEVKATEDLKPVFSATIEVFRRQPSYNKKIASGKSDVWGRFKVKFTTTGNYTIRFTKSGLTPKSVDIEVFGPEVVKKVNPQPWRGASGKDVAWARNLIELYRRYGLVPTPTTTTAIPQTQPTQDQVMLQESSNASEQITAEPQENKSKPALPALAQELPTPPIDSPTMINISLAALIILMIGGSILVAREISRIRIR